MVTERRRAGKDRRRSRAGGRRKGGRPLVHKITFLPSTGLDRFAKAIIDHLTSPAARKALKRRAAGGDGTRKAKPGGGKP